MINTLRTVCVSGPWLDDECVRFIDIEDTANLYDLHVAIQDAVQFDDEFPFYFYTAISPDATRTLIPEDLDVDDDNLDTDAYEDLRALDHIKPGAKTALYYVFKSEDGDWVFKIQHTGTTHKPAKGEFYPLVLDAKSIGPNPEQYGSGFDDFAESEDEFRPSAKRGRGDADYDRDEDFFDDDAEMDEDSPNYFLGPDDEDDNESYGYDGGNFDDGDDNDDW